MLACGDVWVLNVLVFGHGFSLGLGRQNAPALSDRGVLFVKGETTYYLMVTVDAFTRSPETYAFTAYLPGLVTKRDTT